LVIGAGKISANIIQIQIWANDVSVTIEINTQLRVLSNFGSCRAEDFIRSENIVHTTQVSQGVCSTVGLHCSFDRIVKSGRENNSRST